MEIARSSTWPLDTQAGQSYITNNSNSWIVISGGLALNGPLYKRVGCGSPVRCSPLPTACKLEYHNSLTTQTNECRHNGFHISIKTKVWRDRDQLINSEPFLLLSNKNKLFAPDSWEVYYVKMALSKPLFWFIVGVWHGHTGCCSASRAKLPGLLHLNLLTVHALANSHGHNWWHLPSNKEPNIFSNLEKNETSTLAFDWLGYVINYNKLPDDTPKFYKRLNIVIF